MSPLARSRSVGHLLAGAACALLCGAAGPLLADSVSGRWVDAGSTAFPRLAATATSLEDGRVLVVGGGFASTPVADVELHDPATGRWSEAPAAPLARKGHRALRLTDGRVLIVGGHHQPTPDNTSPAHVYDPAAESWSTAGFIRPPRVGHSASLLGDGRVLVVGGMRVGEPAQSLVDVELFDPATETWTEGEPMPLDRHQHTATVLASGRVLVTGGASQGGAHPGGQGAWNDVWLYWPDRDAWGELKPMSTPRHRHAAVSLADGRVLVTGGALMNREPIPDSEIYDTTRHEWAAAAPMSTPRHSHTATLLGDGRVLVQGGFGPDDLPLAGTELFDPATGTWAPGPRPPRDFWHAEALPDGSVLFFGGSGLSYLREAELFDPATGSWTTAGRLATPRRSFALSTLADGGALVRGGSGPSDEEPPPEAERFDPKLLRWEAVESPPSAGRSGGPVSLGKGRTLEVVEEPIGGRTFFWRKGRKRVLMGTTLAVRGEYTATSLPGGRALIVGGWFPDAGGELVAPRAWVLDPEHGVTATAPLDVPRRNHIAVALDDGRVLVAGGETDDQRRISSAEVFDPETGAWTPTARMRSGRISHSAALLPDGRVLVLAGYGGSTEAYRFVP